MRLSTDGQERCDSGGPTVPMKAIPPSPSRPRLPFLQSLYYLVATLVLLGGSLGALAMNFRWLGVERLFDGGAGPHPPAHVVPAGIPSRGPSLLAQDTFARADQLFWGRASDGMLWGGDASNSPAFAIGGGAGTITGGVGFFTALLGPGEANAEEEVSASLSRWNFGRENFGAVLRYSDNNYYKAYLDGIQLVLMKRVGGKSVTLGAVPFTARDGVSYTIRFRALGAQLLARAWLTSAAEPGTWMVSVTDGSLASGFGGLRVLLERGSVARVTAISERMS